MAVRSRFAAGPRAILLCQILGFSFFVLAFFMPACRDMNPEAGSANIFTGWEYTHASLTLSKEVETYQSPFILAVLSGLASPLVVLYLAASYIPHLRALRRAIAFAIPVCLVAAWIFFVIVEFAPMIGHYLWVAGVLLTLLPETLPGAKFPAIRKTPRALHP